MIRGRLVNMYNTKQNVLVIGAALTGIATAMELSYLGHKVFLNDYKSREEIGDSLEGLRGLGVEMIFGSHPIDLAYKCDFIVASPGVPLDIPLIKEARKLGKEVVSEIELSYRLTNAPIAAITGTNGKTTTTALLGEIMKESGRTSYVTGNIGIPMISQVKKAKEEDIFVLEVSSFQLESIELFKPKVSGILNITADHLNRHKTVENYIDAKCRIFKNQDNNDFTILNRDDAISFGIKNLPSSKVLMFSIKEILQEGAYIENGILNISLGGNKEEIIHIDDIYIPGNHNRENALAASLIAYCLNVKPSVIAKVLKDFKGVEHRLEYVCEINGVAYYNDSKGTNPDSSIKAVNTMERPIVLIAGGIDKGSDYYDFIKTFKGKVKSLVLLGDTAEKIERQARELNFINTYKVSDLKEAVYKAKELSKPGDCVLLSPACASWDMFKSFEERGKLFKNVVRSLRGAD